MKLQTLTEEINLARPGQTPFTLEEVAAGFVRVANEGMSRPMRKMTEQRGFAMSTHDLCCFGGFVLCVQRRADSRAGGQHACAIASGLGIETVIVPRFSSILSAYGIACADLTAEAAQPMSSEVTAAFHTTSTQFDLNGRIERLKASVAQQLVEQGANMYDIDYTATVGMSYDGSDTILQIPLSHTLRSDFVDAHLRETSFNMNRRVLMSGVRVQGVGRSFKVQPSDYAPDLELAESDPNPPACKPSASQTAYFEMEGKVRPLNTPVFVLGSIPMGARIAGPAIIVDSTQTIVVEPNATAVVLKEHVIMRVAQTSTVSMTNGITAPDPITLAVFANRFMSIAEQMGHTLQRTSISVSIKERLDFSCSIHGTDGALVANAPHIPVHLGSMQYAVQAQHAHWLGKLKPGDVLLTNHPQWGGTHLPDLTVVTPVFSPDDTQVLFYVASRGHHTDIGGTGVTSMNPISRELWEEGVNITTFKLVSEGMFNEQGVRDLFAAVADHPGCSATRRIDHNLTDLQGESMGPRRHSRQPRSARMSAGSDWCISCSMNLAPQRSSFTCERSSSSRNKPSRRSFVRRLTSSTANPSVRETMCVLSHPLELTSDG